MESSSSHIYKTYTSNQPPVLFDPMRNVLVTSDTFNQFSSLPLSIAINNSVRRLRLSRHYSQRVSPRIVPNNNSSTTERKRRNTVDNSTGGGGSVANPHVNIVKIKDGIIGTNNNSSKSRKNDTTPVARSMSLCVRKSTSRREIPRIPFKVKHVEYFWTFSIKK